MTHKIECDMCEGRFDPRGEPHEVLTVPETEASLWLCSNCSSKSPEDIAYHFDLSHRHVYQELGFEYPLTEEQAGCLYLSMKRIVMTTPMVEGLHELFRKLADEPNINKHEQIIEQAWYRFCSRDKRSIREICQQSEDLTRKLREYEHPLTEEQLHQIARDFMDKYKQPSWEPLSLDEWLMEYGDHLSDAIKAEGQEIMDAFGHMGAEQ